MRYVSIRNDGHVKIIFPFPVAAIRKKDGLRIEIVGQRRTATQTVFYGSAVISGRECPAEIVVGDQDFNVNDLEEDTLPGYTFVFPDVERDVIAKWAPSSRDAVVSTRRVKKDDIPTDRTYRMAWRDMGDAVRVDMPLAREIKRQRIRMARPKAFAALDAAYLKADEAGDEPLKQEIAKQKQFLRDIPTDPAIDAAQTPDELVEFWPEVLGPKPNPLNGRSEN